MHLLPKAKLMPPSAHSESTQAVVPKYDAFGRKYDVAMLSNYRSVVIELEHILKHIKSLKDEAAADDGEPVCK